MKERTMLWVVSGAIAAGVVVYGVYKHLQEQGKMFASVQDTPTTGHNSSDISEAEDIVSNFEQAQQGAVDSIKKNHQDAAQQLNSTLKEMEKDTTQFEDTIKQVNDDLDALLK